MRASNLEERKPGWQRHFFYRKESLKTTWKLRVSVLLLALLAGWITRGFWRFKIGQSLVCEEQIRRSDGLLVENFDPDYLVFERAAALQRKGVADKVFVPIPTVDSETLNTVSESIAEVMMRVARLKSMQVIPILETEPISMNSANQIRDFLLKEHVSSIIVVSPGFRSRRSYLIYKTVFSPVNIAVRCVPVIRTNSLNNWTATWHGIQEVVLQFFKLQYYRFYVLH